MGMIAANGLDPASTFLVFGLFQILTGLRYGLPMPVQPLKAIAAIMITSGLPKEAMFGAGLVLGVAMTVLAVTNLITRIADLIRRRPGSGTKRARPARVDPDRVRRGLGLGLGFPGGRPRHLDSPRQPIHTSGASEHNTE